MRFTRLGNDILKWMIDDAADLNLRQQLSRSTLVKREYTGGGFFLTLEVPKDAPRIRGEEDDINPIPGPYIESDLLDSGGDTVLFVSDGTIQTLEIFAYGDEFPQSLDSYELLKPNRTGSV